MDWPREHDSCEDVDDPLHTARMGDQLMSQLMMGPSRREIKFTIAIFICPRQSSNLSSRSQLSVAEGKLEERARRVAGRCWKSSQEVPCECE